MAKRMINISTTCNPRRIIMGDMSITPPSGGITLRMGAVSGLMIWLARVRSG